MMRKFTNLQTDLLRTFVTVADLRNYTETGNILGRTQPAISLQIKRHRRRRWQQINRTKGQTG